MGVARKWVFPIIRILILAAIAAALVKIAFFPDTNGESGPEFPTAEIVEPQVPVMLGTVYNDVVVQGTVTADAARPIKATGAGEVVKVHNKAGKTTKKGTNIVTIREDVPGQLQPDGSFSSGYSRYVLVEAGSAGTLSSISVIVGQLVTVGEVIGQIAPPTFSVSGALLPDQMYRLLNEPTEATITVIGGPAPFTCAGLRIETTLPGEEPGEGEPPSGTSATCTVPAEIKVFNGLQAEMSIPGGVAENVLVVPVTAVEGIAETGNVYFVLPDGTTEIRPVTLGLNDGINVEVVDGLAEGDLVLQFVPGAPEAVPGGEVPPEGCYDDGSGLIICEDFVK